MARGWELEREESSFQVYYWQFSDYPLTPFHSRLVREALKNIDA